MRTAIILFALAAAAIVVAVGSTGRSQQAVRAGPPSSPSATAIQTAAPREARIVTNAYGRGARGVVVVRPDTSRPVPAVLFLHGWGFQRRTAYRAWIRHLARAGNAVIVPRYQMSLRSDPTRVRAAMLDGVRTALRRIALVDNSLVVAGHSAGAALAADYAAVASDRGLPIPRAVFAVYPGRAIIGTRGIPAADLSRISPQTRLLVMAGARDTVVGRAPALSLARVPARIPRSRRRLVLVRDPAVDDHLAPLRATRSARRTFWRRLDRLIASARR